jgi:hypothetical protein
MKTNKRWKRVWLAGSVVLLAAPWVVVRGAEDEEPGEKPDPGVMHADCVLLGPQRERFARGGMLEVGRRTAAFSEMTSEVARLAPAPARSRTQALLTNGPPLSPIDEILFDAMRASGVSPAELTTDQEFLRRVTLDLTGRIPRPEDVVAFLADTSPNKRAAAVERLLAAPEWVDKWTMFFGDLFKNATRTTQVVRFPQGRDAFYRYLQSSLQQNKPYDQMARELISATGENSYEQGELNFLVGGFMTGGPIQDTFDRQAANVAEMFLGMAHMDCILCHDGRGHLDALSVWGKQATRAQAWGFASFFSRTQLTRVPVGQTAQPYYWSVQDNAGRARQDYTLNTRTGNRSERQPRPGQTRTVAPVYPFSGQGPAVGESYRDALARELTSDPQFARAAVNYVWKQFFGLGIVEPADQFDPGRLDPDNPPPAPWTLQPSNPALLQRLTLDFISSGFHLKALMRQIVSSRTYQLSARHSGTWNPSWDRLYARKLVRRLDAEEIHDALVQSSGVPVSYNIPNLGIVNWAMQLPETFNVPGGRGNTVNAFLDGFLRGDRDEQSRSRESTLPQALSLMNDPFVLARTRVTPPTSLLGRSINLPDDELVQTLFLHVLSRLPTETEQAAAVAQLRSANRTRSAENLLWSLYNKVDFIFNY